MRPHLLCRSVLTLSAIASLASADNVISIHKQSDSYKFDCSLPHLSSVNAKKTGSCFLATAVNCSSMDEFTVSDECVNQQRLLRLHVSQSPNPHKISFRINMEVAVDDNTQSYFIQLSADKNGSKHLCGCFLIRSLTFNFQSKRKFTSVCVDSEEENFEKCIDAYTEGIRFQRRAIVEVFPLPLLANWTSSSDSANTEIYLRSCTDSICEPKKCQSICVPPSPSLSKPVITSNDTIHVTWAQPLPALRQQPPLIIPTHYELAVQMKKGNHQLRRVFETNTTSFNFSSNNGNSLFSQVTFQVVAIGFRDIPTTEHNEIQRLTLRSAPSNQQTVTLPLSGGSQWSSWVAEKCTHDKGKTCGHGKQRLRRFCENGQCYGHAEKNQSCFAECLPGKEALRQFQQVGTCSVSCGKGLALWKCLPMTIAKPVEPTSREPCEEGKEEWRSCVGPSVCSDATKQNKKVLFAALGVLGVVLCALVLASVWWCKNSSSPHWLLKRKPVSKTNGCHRDFNQPVYLIPKPALRAPSIQCGELGRNDPDALDGFYLPASVMYSMEAAQPNCIAYISYARVSRMHDETVRLFAAWVADQGIEVILDLHHLTESAGGIVAWFECQVKKVNSIIIVASPSLKRQWAGEVVAMSTENSDSEGWKRLVKFEANYIRDALAKERPLCIPVILGNHIQEDCQPPSLANKRFFRFNTNKDANHQFFIHHLFGASHDLSLL